MQLVEYQKKRDFTKTREPVGSPERLAIAPQDRLRFVVQKHAARSLHYDFRLENDGVLLSWAVPKGPSLDPSEKRLAVKVEDHPLDYAGFEGEIPAGEYGGGSVLLWDSGSWTPEGDTAEGLKRGRLSFSLTGEKLKGSWHLARMGGSKSEKENWLLIKSRDAYAKPGDADALLRERGESVLSGRDINAIAKGKGKDIAIDASRVAKAKSSAFPRSFAPQLATLADSAPQGADWLHEIKYDGYRLLAFCDGKDITLKTRNGHDWTEKFAGLAKELAALALDRCILDGEAIVVDENGVSNFQMLQNALKERKGKSDVRYMAFDLPYAEGSDLTKAPLLERKRLLKALLASAGEKAIRYSDHVIGQGGEVFHNACRLNLEGIISKRTDSVYVSTRSRNWIKVKCEHRQEFVICGYTQPAGARVGFGALRLGYFDGEALRYVGKVGTGFDDRTLRSLKKRLDPLATETCPFDPPPEQSNDTTWVEPKLVAEIRFAEMTEDGLLRQAVFLGLRKDKDAADVGLETPQPAKQAKATPSKNTRATRRTDKAAARRPELTHPDRVLYPEIGATKERLADYYEKIAPYMLPFVADRPLSLLRHPRGWKEKGFFQKHVDDSFPDSVKQVQIENSEGASSIYGYITDAAGLVGLLQMGVLEIHPWGSRIDDVESPDTLIIDLDPDAGLPFEAVIGAALLLRDMLSEAGLVSFLKSTGGNGLHVVVPIRRGPSWQEVKQFCKSVAESLAKRNPKAFVTTASKAARKGKIYIDYLRNGRDATAIAPYSTRARRGATVAMPLHWHEATTALSPNGYTIENALQRMSHLKTDPWIDYSKTKQALSKAVLSHFGL